MLLSEAISEFVHYMVTRRGSTETTRATYESILASFVRFGGDKDIALLSTSDIDIYANHLANKGDKPKTVHNKLATIRSLVRYLYAKNLSDIRPESVELPRLAQDEANFLTYEEQDALIAVIDNLRDRAIVMTLLDSGLRVSELINLKRDDLYKHSIVVKFGKGKKHRVTFITDNASRAISRYMRTKSCTEHLFTAIDGSHLSRQYVARIVSSYARSAGIAKKVTPHTLRHTFATNLLQNGARVEVVQPLMGHANIRTTLIYAHFTNPYLESEYEKFSTKRASGIDKKAEI